LITPCIDARGCRLAPGSRGVERLLAGACLQRDVDGAPEQRLVARSLRGVEHHFVGRTRVSCAEFNLADQQLIEQRRIER